jgi:S-adenosylmethionine decarboxylase
MLTEAHGGKLMMHHPPGIVPPGGTHLLVDLFESKQLDDLRYVEEICTRAAQATGATVISGHFHHFGEGCGVSGMILLAESHLSIHTWPENQLATVDIYVCGECDATHALPILKDGFSAVRMNVSEHRRGIETNVEYRIRIKPRDHPHPEDERFVIQNLTYKLTLTPETATGFPTKLDAETALRQMPNVAGYGQAIVEEFTK